MRCILSGLFTQYRTVVRYLNDRYAPAWRIASTRQRERCLPRIKHRHALPEPKPPRGVRQLQRLTLLLERLEVVNRSPTAIQHTAERPHILVCHELHPIYTQVRRPAQITRTERRRDRPAHVAVPMKAHSRRGKLERRL